MEKIQEVKQKEEVIDSYEVKKSAYIGFRFIEGLCIAVFIFGLLWEGTETFKLTLPQFMILYGGTGALLSELMARLTMNLIKKKDIKKD